MATSASEIQIEHPKPSQPVGKDEKPSLLQRQLISISSDRPTAAAAGPPPFRIITMNTLADSLCDSESFPHTAPEALDWNVRKYQLLEELCGINRKQPSHSTAATVAGPPQILCIQECDHYADWFQPELAQRGYSQSFFHKKKSTHSKDGVAIFIQDGSFHVAQEECFTMGHSPDLKGMNQVFIILQLIPYNSKNELDSARRLYVVTTHLKAMNGYEIVRLKQVRFITQQLQQFIEKYHSASFASSNHANNTFPSASITAASSSEHHFVLPPNAAVIFAGDFNDVPQAPMYQFLTTGSSEVNISTSSTNRTTESRLRSFATKCRLLLCFLWHRLRWLLFGGLIRKWYRQLRFRLIGSSAAAAAASTGVERSQQVKKQIQPKSVLSPPPRKVIEREHVVPETDLERKRKKLQELDEAFELEKQEERKRKLEEAEVTATTTDISAATSSSAEDNDDFTNVGGETDLQREASGGLTLRNLRQHRDNNNLLTGYRAKKEGLAAARKPVIQEKYGSGDDQPQQAPPKEFAASAATRSDVKEARDENGHTTVWGSFYCPGGPGQPGQWGYDCCHQTIRHVRCTKEPGTELDPAERTASTLPIPSSSSLAPANSLSAASTAASSSLRSASSTSGSKRTNSAASGVTSSSKSKSGAAETTVATGGGTIRHSFWFHSLYNRYYDRSHRLNYPGELYTTVKRRDIVIECCIDYILYTPTMLRPTHLLNIPNYTIQLPTYLPATNYPSDHLAIEGRFEWN